MRGHRSLVQEILLREVRKMELATIEAFEKELKKRKEDLIVKDLLLRLAPKDDAVIHDVLLNHLAGIEYSLEMRDENVAGLSSIVNVSFIFDEIGAVYVMTDLIRTRFYEREERVDIEHFCEWVLRTSLNRRVPFGIPLYCDVGRDYVYPIVYPIHAIFNKLLLGIDCEKWEVRIPT